MVPQRCKLPLYRKHSSRLLLDRRYVNRLQWQMLKQLQGNLIEPEEFYARWHVTYKQIAKICFCSESTVCKWLVHTSARREPSIEHKFILGVTNKLWIDLLTCREGN
jgi:hypothetical protein